MNEVEKMYKLANIQPQYKKRIECKEGYTIGQPCGKSPCIDCNKSVFEDVMPPFTPEKQLELIKWLGIKDEFNFYQNKVTKDWIFYDHEKDATHYNFELGLASWVNYLWQDLTEEEHTQIKEILSE